MEASAKPETFFVDGRQVGPDECRALFTGPLSDRARQCLALVEGKNVVDIGCYSGNFVARLIETNPRSEATGIDYTDDHIRLAKFLHPEIADKFRRMSVYALDFPDDSQDCVTFQEVIEHLEKCSLALREINRVLKPGGTFIVTTPNPYAFSEMKSFFGHELKNVVRGLLGRKRQLKSMVYFENVEWNRHIYAWTPMTLLTLLEELGFEYVDNGFSSDAGGFVHAAILKLFPFFGPCQILKVRKVREAPAGAV